MQGYDAVAMETDVQVGGTDQLFNLMAGRKLMEAFGLKPQVVLTSRILVGTDGVIRMSKSTGNSIGIDESPGVMFTKVLNVPDSAMRNYAELITRWSPEEIGRMFADIESGALSMREFKHNLGREIVSIYHGEEAAEQAAADAAAMHSGEAPSDAPTFTLRAPSSIIDILFDAGVVKSKSEGRRLVQQGGVRLNGSTVNQVDAPVQPNGEQVIQVGKQRFLRVVS
jgi:tyrosyl-tRNA synthetase